MEHSDFDGGLRGDSDGGLRCDHPGNIMQDTLSLSTRRWATAVDAALIELLYNAGQREWRR